MTTTTRSRTSPMLRGLIAISAFVLGALVSPPYAHVPRFEEGAAGVLIDFVEQDYPFEAGRFVGTCLLGEGDCVDKMVIRGPLDGLDIHIDGASAFEPVRLSPNVSKTEAVHAVFAFVRDHFVSWNSAPGLDVRALLFGTGYGLCGESANIMCSLWAQFGVPCRTVSWPRHVMAEANIDGAWHLFDAQHGRDFSAVNRQAVSAADLLLGNAKIAKTRDVAGYRGSYLHRVIQEAEPRVSNFVECFHRPAFTLTPNQKMVIRRRHVDAPSRLPISDQPQTCHRLDVIPSYEVTISTSASDTEETAWFFTGLPVTALDFAGTERIETRTSAQSEFTCLDQVECDRRLLGRTAGFWLNLKPGGSVTVTYALAAWVGDRIFDGGHTRNLTFFSNAPASLKLFRHLESPQVRIRRVLCGSPPILGEICKLFVDLDWRSMPDDAPRQYQITLEELSSELVLEVWQKIGQVTWTYDSTAMAPDGRTRLVFNWVVTNPAGPYRDAKYRTLLVRLTGPGLIAGHNYLKKRVNASSNRRLLKRRRSVD